MSPTSPPSVCMFVTQWKCVVMTISACLVTVSLCMCSRQQPSLTQHLEASWWDLWSFWVFFKTFLCCIITELSLCSLRVLWHLEMLSDILYVWTPCPRRPLTFDVFGLNMNNLGHFGAVLKVGCSSNDSDFTVCHSACDFMNELMWTFNKTCVVCVCFSGDCRDSCAAAVFCK